MNKEFSDIDFMKRIISHQKHFLILSKIDSNKEKEILNLLSEMFRKLVLIEKLQKEKEINKLDSLLDMLSSLTPDFYNEAYKIYDINKELESFQRIKILRQTNSRRVKVKELEFTRSVLIDVLQETMIAY